MSVSLTSPKNFINREISWIRFNERVLDEARNERHPLLERLKFLSIFSSNLDEFYMIRVAGLKEQIHNNIYEPAADGMKPKESLKLISELLHPLVKQQSDLISEDILPALRKKGIRIRSTNTLSASQALDLKKYFKEKIFPVITPLAVDSGHPFPKLRSLGLNLLVELKTPFKRNENKIAVVPVPQSLPRFIPVPSRKGDDFVVLEQLLKEHLDLLFPNMKINRVSEFRITRNADIDLSEAEADDLLKQIERELRKRRLGTVIRLEVSSRISPESRRFLMEMNGLEEQEVYDIPSFLDLASFMNLMDLDYPELKDIPFTPALNTQIVRHENIFQAIKSQDILLHHPYDSFHHVIEFVQEAAKDPQVMAIKMTLYRTSGKSPIVQALKDAVANGKQVTALIELKARFDEETNIVWAKELERVGVNVVYGLMGLKTHCKTCLVVRQEEDHIIRYVHLGTGNYNVRTSKIYTDLGIFTCSPEIGKDVSELFNMLTGYSRQDKWRKIAVAPVNLRESFVKLLNDCMRNHTPENPSSVRLVMNALVDPSMIQQLYRASRKGIKVELLIRGICCLIPGIKDLSENISVRSIVGRFLEHSRIYSFTSNGQTKLFLGSADWMQRNLNRRIEVMFPVESAESKTYILNILETSFNDTVNARVLGSDSLYRRVKKSEGGKEINCQHIFLHEAMRRQKIIDTIS
jgi:polyphosphate kinase